MQGVRSCSEQRRVGLSLDSPRAGSSDQGLSSLPRALWGGGGLGWLRLSLPVSCLSQQSFPLCVYLVAVILRPSWIYTHLGCGPATFEVFSSLVQGPRNGAVFSPVTADLLPDSAS